MGSRYGGLKQIDPMGPSGESVLDYSVHDARRAGFERVIFVIRRDIEEAFKAAVGARYEGRIQVDYAFQQLEDLPGDRRVPDGRSKPWGTGHAVFAARELIDGPIVVINADDFYGRQAFELMYQFLTQPDGANALAMIAFPLQQTLSPSGGKVNRGICKVEDGKLLTVEEVEDIHKEGGRLTGTAGDGRAVDLAPDSPVSMNFWGLPASIMPELARTFEAFLDARGGELKSEFYLPAFIDGQIESGNASCAVMRSPDPWFGVTYPEDKEEVRKRLAELVRAGVYSSPLDGADMAG